MNTCRVPQDLTIWNVGGNLVVAEASGPGGGSSSSGIFAFSLTEPTVSGQFYVDWFFTDASASGQLIPLAGPFSISAFMKSNGRTWAWLDAGDGDVDRYAYFDLENGVVGTTSGADVSATIQDVGGGWYLCTMYSVSQVSEEYGVPDNTAVSIGPADSDGGFGYLGNGTGIYVAQVQFSAAGQELSE